MLTKKDRSIAISRMASSGKEPVRNSTRKKTPSTKVKESAIELANSLDRGDSCQNSESHH